MKKIAYGKQYIDSSDIKAVSEALRKEMITQGSLISEFENKVKKFLNVKYAVAVSSASAGLHIAVKSLPLIKKNDLVITNPITFVSTANAATHNMMKVKFSDIDNFTLNFDIKSLIKKIKDLKPKVILPVHLSGLSSGEKILKKICKRKKIFIIEDAAHSFGAKYGDGSLVGNCRYSDMTVFSFHPVKTITTGEGGMITTNSYKIYRKLIELRNHGIVRSNNHFQYDVKDLSFNYRITDFQCALGLSQLRKIKKIIAKRESIAKKYDLEFSNNKNIYLPQYNLRNLSSNHLYILNIKFENLRISRNQFIKKLMKLGIITQIHYIPVPKHSYYSKKGYTMKGLKNAQKYYNRAISIPIYYSLKSSEQLKVVKIIKNIINEYKKN